MASADSKSVSVLRLVNLQIANALAGDVLLPSMVLAMLLDF